MTEEREAEGYEAPIDLGALGWDGPEPPAGFSAGVADAFAEEGREVASVRSPARPPRDRRLWIAGAIALAAALLLWMVVPRGGETTRDSLSTDVMRTVAIRDRAVAVAQAGTDMGWEVDSDGTARVEQNTGRVFYRVDDGRPFEVKTPAGTVVVTGTCFEVEMTPMKRQSLKSATLGAALASAVLVTVYEGQVVLANERGEVTLEPGQRATADAERAPARWGDDGSSDENAGSTGGIKSIRAGVDPIATVRRQAQDLERLRAEKDAQYQEMEALRQQVEELGGAVEGRGPEALKARAKKCAIQSRGGDCPFLDPDQETLLEMAKCGTVKIDYPGFLDDLDAPDAVGFAESIGAADPAEQAAIQAAAEKHHAAFNGGLRDMYIELGGSPEVADESSADVLQAYIADQMSAELLGDVQRRVAEERAGLREPPADLSQLPIEERFWRLRAEMGNDFEQHVARELGPERARELRGVKDGWPGSTSVHSSDCRE